jgi:hypothetical protein
MHRKQTCIFAVFAGVCLLTCTCFVHAGVNPEFVNVPVKYRQTAGSPDRDIFRWFPGAGYRVLNSGPWCGTHYTDLGREYDHAHSTNGFPFWDTLYGTTVTTTKANYGYDAAHPGWTRSGSPSCAYVCHNYAMDETGGPLIASGTYGVGRWRPDAGYTSISEPTSSCIHSTSSHSYKIIAVYPCPAPHPDHVKTKKQKSDSSAIYTITLSSPGDHHTSHLYDD